MLLVGGEMGGGVPLGGRRPTGRRCKGGREGGNWQMVEKKAAKLLCHQNLVVCLEASVEDKFFGKQRELIEKLVEKLRRLSI